MPSFLSHFRGRERHESNSLTMIIFNKHIYHKNEAWASELVILYCIENISSLTSPHLEIAFGSINVGGRNKPFACGMNHKVYYR